MRNTHQGAILIGLCLHLNDFLVHLAVEETDKLIRIALSQILLGNIDNMTVIPFKASNSGNPALTNNAN